MSAKTTDSTYPEDDINLENSDSECLITVKEPILSNQVCQFVIQKINNGLEEKLDSPFDGYVISSSVECLQEEKTNDDNLTDNLEDLQIPCKKLKTGNELSSLKALLFSVEAEIVNKVENLNRKVFEVNSRCQSLDEKLEQLLKHTKDPIVQARLALASSNGRNQTVILRGSQEPGSSPKELKSSSSLQFITLNTEADYPNGSWLGDPNNPEMRVRCHIRKCDLENIEKACTTPEKLALTLLDYLFDRETQACSNISGTGKHGKKQLDPLKIYGIRCHLMFKYNITAQCWNKIKQNLDSKCRTAFRRKQKGMPLMCKAFRDRFPAPYVQLLSVDEVDSDSLLDSVINSPSQNEKNIKINDEQVDQEDKKDLAESPDIF